MKHLTFILLLVMTCSLVKAQQDDREYIVKVGEKTPNIELLFPDGTKKQLKDLKGKVIMIQFTASWCGVCRKEMPFIEKDIWLKYKNNPAFALFGINFKESKETTEKFAKDIKITYPLLLDPEGKAFYTYAAQEARVTRNIIIDKFLKEANANRYTFVWKKSTKTHRDKLDFKVKSILNEAEKQLDAEFHEPSDSVMTSEEMAKRTDELLATMDERGISDKKLRKSVRASRTSPFSQSHL